MRQRPVSEKNEKKSPDDDLPLMAVTGGWLEQSKKRNDEILSQKMKQKSKSFESALSCAGSSNLSLRKMKRKSPDNNLQLTAVSGGWLEESKKRKDAILSYEKMNGKVSWFEEVEAESKKIYDEILLYEKMNGKVSWLEEVEAESKKIHDEILSYEK